MSTATADSRIGRKWPRRGILAAALAISAVLNLFFVAGAVWTHVRPQPPTGLEQRFERIAAQLNLDPQQRVGFEHYAAAMRARNAKLLQQLSPSISAAWDEIAKPDADASRVMQQLDAATDKRRELQHEAVALTLDFLSILSPAQRSSFVAIARERRPQRARHQP